MSDKRRLAAARTMQLTDEARAWIVALTRQQLSPQQVADYLRRHQQVSLHHEMIYQWIAADSRPKKTRGCHSPNALCIGQRVD